jgi:hypothetical protein
MKNHCSPEEQRDDLATQKVLDRQHEVRGEMNSPFPAQILGLQEMKGNNYSEGGLFVVFI